MKTAYLLCPANTSANGSVTMILLMIDAEEVDRLSRVMKLASELQRQHRTDLGPQPAIRSFLTPWFFGYRANKEIMELWACHRSQVSEWAFLPADFNPDSLAEHSVLQSEPRMTITEDDIVFSADEKYRDLVYFRSASLTKELLQTLRTLPGLSASRSPGGGQHAP